MSIPSAISFFYYSLRGFRIFRSAPFGFLPRFSSMNQREEFEDYLHKCLFARLGFEDAVVEYLGQRSNPMVARVRGMGGKDFLVRCFRRRRKAKSFEHAYVSQLLRDAGVCVPCLIYFDTCYHTLGRYGFDIVVEEFIEGSHARAEDFQNTESEISRSETSANLLAQLAGILNRLHACRNPLPGKPWRDGAVRIRRKRNRESGCSFFTVRESLMLEGVTACEWLETDDGDIERLSARFEQHRERIDSGPRYCLLHGDLQAMNLLLRKEDGAMTLIDFGTVRYGLWPWDFVVFHNGAVEENSQITARLLALYRSDATDWNADYFNGCWSYMAPWFHLEKAASSIRKHRRSRGLKTNGGDFQARARYHYRRALEVLDELSPLAEVEEKDGGGEDGR